MRAYQARAETEVRPDSTAALLHGRWFVLARIVWVALVTLALVLFLVSIPALYRQFSMPPAAIQGALAQLGLSLGFYAAYLTARYVVFGLGCFLVAAIIIWRKSDEAIALFASLSLVLLGAVNGANALALEELHPALLWPTEFALFLTFASLMLFFFVFPDGRFVPRWSRIPALVWVALLAVTPLLTGESFAQQGSFAGVVMLSGFACGVIAQIYRYRQVSTALQRQQTKWVVFGTVAAFLVQLAALLPIPLYPSLTPPGLQATPYDLPGVTAVTIGYFLIPLAIGMAILRYRLWEIDILINRTLVYGALTACVVSLYVLVVGALGAVVQAQGNILLAVLATGLVAILFQPLRERLQRAVNRLMYGDRDDPYAVLSRLGQRLEATFAPDAVLPTIVETVKEALKLPYVAIALTTNDQRPTTNDERPTTEDEEAAFGVQLSSSALRPSSPGTGVEIVASSGETPVASSPDHLVAVSLIHQGETIGQLLLAPRAVGETFSPVERRLLDDLARQAGVAAHGVRLTADLQRSRERLVTAREEERRRLRRDLHDGLGPQLAALTLKLETARNRLAHDPLADTLLADITERTQAAVSDIRRLVYALRPPILDEFGLVAALREVAAQHSQGGTDSVQITVDAPDCLPPLPAAVEVAAYRIVQEALTNVVHHAGAHTCIVCLSLDEAAGLLWLEIEDDGRGLGAARRAGVGFQSMRERAEELGGSCEIESVPGGGTTVRARLPVS